MTSRPEATRGAIMAGAAIGFMPEYEAKACSDLVALQPPHEDWAVPMWLVTHVDLHRTEKVQAILRCIKDTYPQRMTKHS